MAGLVSGWMSLFVPRQWGQCRFPGMGTGSVFLPGKQRAHIFASLRGCFVLPAAAVALPTLSVELASFARCLGTFWADPMFLKGAPLPLVRCHRSNSPTKRGPSLGHPQSWAEPRAQRLGLSGSLPREKRKHCAHTVPAPPPGALSALRGALSSASTNMLTYSKSSWLRGPAPRGEL